MLSRRIFIRNGGLALVSLGFAPSFLTRTVQAAGTARQKTLEGTPAEASWLVS